MNSVNVSRELDLTVYKKCVRKRDKFSNRERKLVLKSIAKQDTKKAREIFRNSTITSTQSISIKNIIFHSKVRE